MKISLTVRRGLPCATFLLVLVLGISCPGSRPGVPADLILMNASVVTMNPARPEAQAVAVGGGKIVFVGSNSGASKFGTSRTRTIDLAGKMVLPGFQDSHVHLITGGLELGQCNLNGLSSKEEIFARIKDYAASHPETSWIVGGGWDLPAFPGANPSKKDLDRLIPDRPACLSAADGHSSWVNSKALELAKISASTPDPPGGRIERDTAGRPTGTLRESAQELVEALIPEPADEEYRRGLRAGLSLANRFGITSIIEASASLKLLAYYAEADQHGELSVRVLASLYVDPEKGEGQIAELARLRDRYKGARLEATAAKIFVDGVMESHTAALLEPYLDRPGDAGPSLLTAEELDRLAVGLDAAGFQIHVHAIGDRAVRMSLDALEAAGKANGPRDSRHHIAHLELIDPQDIPRFKALGVVANFQALWAYADPYITDLTLPILGPERSRWLYPIGSVAASGALVAGGSDWSVSSMNPLDAIQVAITRRGLEDAGSAPWIPEERISLTAILAAYTTNGAYLSRREKTSGSLEVGKSADIIVLDRNLLAIPPEEIHKAKVLLTLLEGREVYSALD